MRPLLADPSRSTRRTSTRSHALGRLELPWRLVLLIALAALALNTGLAAADLLEDAGEALVAASADRDGVVADREVAEQRLIEVGRVARAGDTEWREFTEEQRALIRELDTAVSEARANAVLAYMWAGSHGPLDDLRDGGISNSDGVRRHFAVGRVDVARDAAGRLQALVDDANDHHLVLARETSRLAAAVEAATVDLDRLLAAERDADQKVADAAEALAQAEKAESDKAAARAAAARAAARAKLPPPSELGIPSAEQWAKLRNCESTNNYQAVNPSGRYRGAYQFDLKTWQSMGGSGDPAAAPPEEQDRRAQMLYDSRGRFPWPECGRFLP